MMHAAIKTSASQATYYHVGMIVPSSNLTMETELPRMFTARQELFPNEHFIFHSSRMRMKKVTPEELIAMNAQIPRAAGELADARPDIVATACLVAIMAQGPKYHCTGEADIRTALAENGLHVPVVSTPGHSSAE